MKKCFLLITICFSLDMLGQQGGVKNFKPIHYHLTEKGIQNSNLNNWPASIRLRKQILSSENFIIKNPLQQISILKSILPLKEKKEFVSTLGNQIDFFNTVRLEHIITGESDITLFKMNFKALTLTVEAFENIITSTSLTVQTPGFLLPAIAFTYEPGTPVILLAGFVLNF
jgi:hypothetical protein